MRFALSGVIATGASIGVAIFYAGRDEKIREELEKVPFAQQALSSIYGEKKKPEGHEQTPDIALRDTGFEKKEAEESLIKPPSEVYITKIMKYCNVVETIMLMQKVDIVFYI